MKLQNITVTSNYVQLSTHTKIWFAYNWLYIIVIDNTQL